MPHPSHAKGRRLSLSAKAAPQGSFTHFFTSEQLESGSFCIPSAYESGYGNTSPTQPSGYGNYALGNSYGPPPASPSYISASNRSFSPMMQNSNFYAPPPVSPSYIGALNANFSSMQMSDPRTLSSTRGHCRTYPEARKSRAIHKLTKELCGMIFLHCLPNEGYTRPSRLAAPLSISQVCRRWRSIALESPKLWCSIHIMRNLRARHFPSPALLSAWLTRAGKQRLEICFAPEDPDDRSHRTHAAEVKQILDTLVYFIDRWSDVKLYTRYVNISSLKHIPSTGAPRLESLELVGPSDFKEFSTRVSNIWAASPRFKEFKMEHWGAPSTSPGFLSIFNLPFQQLTSISLSSTVSVIECIRMLQFSPKLVNCVFENISVGSLPHPSNAKVATLHNLRSLELTVDLLEFDNHSQHMILAPILNTIKAPHLQSLILGSEERWSQQAFDAFMGWSQCPLESLTLDVVSLTDKDLEKCLHRVSNTLTHLKIHTGSDHPSPLRPALLQKLSFDPRGFYCPFLKTISVNRQTILGSDGAFGSMIKSRWYNPGRRLRKVVLEIDTKREHYHDVRRLENMQREGLKLDISERGNVLSRCFY